MLEAILEEGSHSDLLQSNILDSITHCSEHMSVDASHQHDRKRSLECLIKKSSDLVMGREPRRKKQMVKGILQNEVSIAINILFYTQSWPALCLNLFGLAPDASVWVCTSAPIPKGLSTSFPQQIRWVSRWEAVKVAEGVQCQWIIVQGSSTFVEEVLGRELLRRSGKARVLCLIPSCRVHKGSVLKRQIKKWYRVSHADIGGVSLSRWLIGLSYLHNSPLQSLPDKDWIERLSTFGLKRQFRDVLKCTLSGTPTDIPSKGIPELISLRAAGAARFTVPSYKSHSGWVSRELSFMEVGSVFDVSELTLTLLENGGATKAMFAEDMPPLKICHATKVLVLAVTANSTSSNMVVVAPSSVLSVIPKPCTSSTEEPLALLQDMDIRVDPHDIAGEYLARYGDKAAKGEDARIPTELWDGHLFRHYFPSLTYQFAIHGRALKVLREKFLFRYMLRSSIRSLAMYLSTTYGASWLSFYLDHRKWYSEKTSRKRKRGGDEKVGDLVSRNKFHRLAMDMRHGFEALTRLAKSSWWEWKGGSSLLFWRWPREIREAARDGYPIFIRSKLPRWRRTQRLPKEKAMVAQMTKKFEKVRAKAYVSEGTVLSMINCFAVAKGDDDIRLVYDGTKSGLNACVWAPNFFLPSVDSMLMNMNVHTWCADLDLSEMFLNYPLHKDLAPYAGVDYTAILQADKAVWLRWNRMFMGFTPSPYITGKMFGWTIDVIMGDRWDNTNPFRWDSVAENFPGTPAYDPCQPRLVRMSESKIAAAIEAYVDDLRLLGHSELNCHAATSRAAKLLQYLGQQNATRKYRPPHVKPGPWCGSFVAVREAAVWVYTSQEKWDKAKRFVSELSNLLSTGDTSQVSIDYKFLERGVGFLIYFCRTYTSFVPYLKGMHLTKDSWRQGRDQDGWKVKDTKQLLEWQEEEDLTMDAYAAATNLIGREPREPLTLDQAIQQRDQPRKDDHPIQVIAVPRLKDDVAAFMSLLSHERAPWRFVRGGKVGIVHYGFGDASKSGFGSSIGETDGTMWFQLGIWGTDESNESSNYRELANLVQTLRQYHETKSMKGIELFLFTDNGTAEAAFFKGSSKSKKLFQLVLELRQLEVTAACKINFIHVAGTRMIAQGTDGLSRGDLNEGVMKGDPLTSFIPLHRSAMDRQPELKTWVKTFVLPAKSGEEIIFLDYEGWFEKGHDIIGGERNEDNIWMPKYRSATYVWSPPPAGAQIAVEQLRRARLKRELSTHVMIVPRVMAPEWRRQLFKVADLCIDLPFDEHWIKHVQHEPLTFAVSFPFLPHSPWQLKRTPAFLAMGDVLRSLWKDSEVSTGSVLHKLFCTQRGLSNLSPGMVRQMLQGPGEFGFLRAPRTE